MTDRSYTNDSKVESTGTKNMGYSIPVEEFSMGIPDPAKNAELSIGS